MPDWWDWNAVGAIGQWAGATATTAAVIVALQAEQRARKTHVVLKVTIGATGTKMKGPTAFMLSAVNHSVRSVVLDGGGIVLRDGRQLGPITAETLTGEVGTFEKREATFSVETVARWMTSVGYVTPTELRFFVRDTTGKQHTCSHIFDPTPWANRDTGGVGSENDGE